MTVDDIIKTGYSMPISSPAFPRGPYRFINREYLIITYRTDAEKLRSLVPEPLEIDNADPLVQFEFIRMPDSTGFGDYTEAGQVIPVSFAGKKGNYVHSMYLNDHSPIAGGRELWGFPKKLGYPTLQVDSDTLLGELHYGKTRIAIGTMGFKHQPLDLSKVKAALEAPNFLLKIIPHVDGIPRILELVEYHCQHVKVKEAWDGPAGLQLFSHALAPVTDLPVLEVVSAKHIIADLTLGLGQVIHDYLSDK